MTPDHSQQLPECQLQFELQREMRNDIKELRRALLGNGAEGLIHNHDRRLRELERLPEQLASNRASITSRFDVLEELIRHPPLVPAQRPPVAVAASRLPGPAWLNERTAPYMVIGLLVLVIAGILGLDLQWPW